MNETLIDDSHTYGIDRRGQILVADGGQVLDAGYDAGPTPVATPDHIATNRETKTDWGTSPEARRKFKVDIGLIDGAGDTYQRSRDIADASSARVILSRLPVSKAEADRVVSRLLRQSLNPFNAHYDGFIGAVCAFALVESERVSTEDVEGLSILSCDVEALAEYVEGRCGV